MATGDIIFQSGAFPLSGVWDISDPAQIEFNLYSEEATNLNLGSLSLVARIGNPPYGQGWPDRRSPFTPGKSYRVTITEL